MGRFEAKTSMKGQATIPIEVRKALGLSPGGSVQFIVSDDGKVSVVAKKKGLSHLRGIFGKHEGPPLDIDEAIMESIAEKTKLSRSGGDE
ncbi:AbrB/MazE/SpoVT family DNA-binding domain-containing protein [Neorhizobium sp. DT-125]|uniref:AbrB/MazE/SpoVT family DNA-binding domain-containing protein n=1 Tax=Neorhizobium sp. DT-125 TaxID=3396163 RepID=UPI003F1B9A11